MSAKAGEEHTGRGRQQGAADRETAPMAQNACAGREGEGGREGAPVLKVGSFRSVFSVEPFSVEFMGVCTSGSFHGV